MREWLLFHFSRTECRYHIGYFNVCPGVRSPVGCGKGACGASWRMCSSACSKVQWRCEGEGAQSAGCVAREKIRSPRAQILYEEDLCVCI